MIRKLTDNLPEYDLCIIGAGPAGLTIAAELAYSGLKICVLESGLDKKSAFADSLKEVESEGLQIKPNSRERVVGGASATWGGLSAPLDEIDFEPRAWTEGWPFNAEDLKPYWNKAVRYRYPAPSEFVHKQNNNDLGPWKDLEPKKFIAVMPPYRYVVLKYMFERNSLDLITDATAIRLITNTNNSTQEVKEVICKSSHNEQVLISAKRFVLAAGGIENSRLLLNSSLGNEHDQVGRYFMNHPKGYVGILKLSNHLGWNTSYIHTAIQSHITYTGLRLSPQVQREQQVLNSYVTFENFFLSRVLRRVDNFHGKVGRRLSGSVGELWQLIRPRMRAFRFLWYADMEPRADNRVTLSEKQDTLGVPIPRVIHSLGERDKKTFRILHAQLKENIEHLRLGEFLTTPEEVVEGVALDASHHMGGTRMGIDPRNSVVDQNCRVHSVGNLYMAGSSIFPTGGSANPTYTIAALSIRLAEHLAKSDASEIKKETKRSEKKIVIVGAGKRITEDVVPVLEFLENTFSITGIYARGSGVVFGRKRQYDVLPLNLLSADSLVGVDYIYVAVRPYAVEEVLKKVLTICSDSELVLDTPAPLSWSTRRLLKRFKKVHIAEDNAYVPWIDSARARQPKDIFCDRSVFRYHGIALLKALCGTLGNPAKVRYGWSRGGIITLRVGAAQARITDARDYANGRLLIDGKEVPFPTLTPQEVELIGGLREGDTIVNRMLELKRIGLVRMLAMIAEGKEPWPLAEGINDAWVDWVVHRFKFYFSW